MNAEHLLDAVGLLDDDLIREAEEYSRPKPRFHYGLWLSWAASFAVVLVLGYGVAHLRMSGGAAESGGASAPSASAPAGGPAADALLPPLENESSDGIPTGPAGECDPPGTDECGPSIQEIFGLEGDQKPAILVNGTLYRFASAYTVAHPEEKEIRYSTSYTDGVPEEDGQINFPKEGVRYFMLEDGGVALNWNGSDEWMIFAPDPPLDG